MSAQKPSSRHVQATLMVYGTGLLLLAVFGAMSTEPGGIRLGEASLGHLTGAFTYLTGLAFGALGLSSTRHTGADYAKHNNPGSDNAPQS